MCNLRYSLHFHSEMEVTSHWPQQRIVNNLIVWQPFDRNLRIEWFWNSEDKILEI